MGGSGGGEQKGAVLLLIGQPLGGGVGGWRAVLGQLGPPGPKGFSVG